MRVLFFANKMPDLCGAFLHDIDLATEFQKRGHSVSFLTIKIPSEGFQGGYYRGFRFMHYTAAGGLLESSDIWICPHSPILPDVRKANSRGYNRPLVATCHFDGNYTAITGNWNPKWNEMLLFINGVMEPNYRKNIVPWPSNITRTDVIRPIMHRDKITIPEPFSGEYITLINANQNKGVHIFIDLAKRMPDRKFLGILPYYGEKQLPLSPSNIDWIPFDDDIRTILRKTRILLVPSYYESFGRIAVEAMYNGIPVLYSKPLAKPRYPGGSTEGVEEWIKPAGISCERDNPDEWMTLIASLDDQETYNNRSEVVKQHIRDMNLFTEASRVAGLVEQFVRENPVKIQTPQSKQQESVQTPQTATKIVQPTGRVGFSSGRLRIQR
jgi:glycosyltransferase involved in cell wall biosynthesis